MNWQEFIHRKVTLRSDIAVAVYQYANPPKGITYQITHVWIFWIWCEYGVCVYECT